jgi:DNA-binding transcriptional MerR regulator|tara:strand:+ start:301 stop:735 length:435 start_codon:yes stop_codon:yes gene_type:complete
LVIEKSPQAFRTISEASEILSLPSHVLRFWESKFKQIKPLKRAGGRRFYRPNDILFILGIKKLLHIDGLTINGVKRLIKENGVNHVINIGKGLKDNNLNFQPKEPLLKKIKTQKTNINKEIINDAIDKLNFLKLKIESRILNDL